jgi:hypothetical protein
MYQAITYDSVYFLLTMFTYQSDTTTLTLKNNGTKIPKLTVQPAFQADERTIRPVFDNQKNL